jgi:hypothetical protein
MKARFGMALAAFVLSTPIQAQWLNQKTPGIPRTPDGKPDLSAPAPRLANGTPDFSGLWRTDNSGSAELGKAMDAIKPQPWAVALAKKRKEELFRDSPGVLCLPPGPIDRTWMDGEGHPHTEALRVTERFRRPDFGHLEELKTLTDPGALMEPWVVPFKFEFDADTEPLEYVCNENERDLKHLTGKASDLKGIAVAGEILAKYVGLYEYTPPDRPDLRVPVEIVLDGDRLVMTGGGPRVELIALSTAEFATADGAGVEFFKDANGVVTHLIARIVEGDIKAVKKK